LTKPLQFVLVALAALFAAGVLYQLTSRAVRWAGRPGGD